MDDNGSCKGESGEYELTEDGKQIKAYIRATINDFEYIAVGILNGAFDERIIKDGMRGMVKSTYNSFSGYIDHVRDTEKVPAFAENLEWLANRWSDNKKSKSLRA